MKRDPTHEKNLKIVLKLSPMGIKDRLEVIDYKDPDYIASEILVSLLRMHYGERTGVLALIVQVLYSRLTKYVGQFVQKNPEWYGLVNTSSETRLETVSYAWEKLLFDDSDVSLAEVRFIVWVKRRAVDYFRSLLTEKHRILTDMRVTPKDEHGNEISFEELIGYDEDDGPDQLLERCNLTVDVKISMFQLEPNMRKVVYLRLECAKKWEIVAKQVGVSIPKARGLFREGVKRLSEVVNG